MKLFLAKRLHLSFCGFVLPGVWRFLALGGLFVSLTLGCSPLVKKAFAQDKSRIPPLSLYHTMLKANQANGWVNFRNFNNRQYIYFTPLQVLHCRIQEIRYSINSETLNQRFQVASCNPQLPFSLPPNSGPEAISVNYPMFTAKTVAVQIVWDDGTESEVSVYEPCENVDDATCAFTVRAGKLVSTQPRSSGVTEHSGDELSPTGRKSN